MYMPLREKSGVKVWFYFFFFHNRPVSDIMPLIEIASFKDNFFLVKFIFM